MFAGIAHNVQGFALGQSEITNYRTLGSVAANNFQKPHCRHGLAQNPLLAAAFLSFEFSISFNPDIVLVKLAIFFLSRINKLLVLY